MIIMVGVLLPMLFATECCANMCAEAIALDLPRSASISSGIPDLT